jgi:hypothetical protein
MRRAAALVVVALAAAAPAAADWLVLADGTRVETRGAWERKGRLVVFTSAQGRLSSLRADGIDLEASRRASDAAQAAAERPASAEPAAAAPASRAVRRITNADLPAASPPPPAVAGETPAEASGEAAAAAAGAAAATARELEVRDAAQETHPVDGHLIVRGRLANRSTRTAAAVELLVHVHGPEGEVMATLPAALDVAALSPGAVTGFTAHFLDVYRGASALRFVPRATFLETGPVEEPPADADAEPQP